MINNERKYLNLKMYCTLCAIRRIILNRVDGHQGEFGKKVYDRLKWEFVKDTLSNIGISSSFINLIWNYISTVRMKMLWNGEALEEFNPMIFFYNNVN